ncbi:zeta toxin family protein [Streptomyces katrae]|uniref:zeta toxin family protein n=1 Tax=Streptomyces katrae TaxID=68223 RepID=UPI0006986B1E|nr:zeta toxin family protein [Streptomyces katrae]
MTDPEAARYLLPEAQNRGNFLGEIVPDQFAGRLPQQKRTVVFLVGQPGAGKTRVGHMLANALNKRGGFIDVDSDLYKPFHPEYAHLMQQDDKLMAASTRADGRRWMAQAHDYVRENRLNAVIQETSQDGEAVAATMRAYRGSGFRVEVVAMGVSEAMSNQGIVNRYHEQVKERGSGRLTVQANAEQSYSGILELARLVDEHALADHVSVFRRGEGEPRYSNVLDDFGQWQRQPGLAQAITQERSRPWTVPESADFLQSQGKLHLEMGPEWADSLTCINQLARPTLHPLPLLSDHELSTQGARAAVAVQAAERQTDAGRTPQPSLDERLALLAERGASAADLERARHSLEEDRLYESARSAQAAERIAGLQVVVSSLSAEQERRRMLPPSVHKAETAGRNHQAALEAAVQRPAQEAPRIRPPEHEGPSRPL